MNPLAVGLLARANLRRQRGSLGLLVVLVALVSGIVLAGLAGAHRTATVLDRFLEATNQGDLGVWVQGLPAADAPGFFKAIPGVRDAASVEIFLAQPTQSGVDFDFTILSSPDGRWGSDVNQVLVREGRLPADGRSDEVALNRPAAEALGLGVGDMLGAETISPESFGRLITGQGGFTLDGPPIDPRIVGLVETGEDLQGSTQQSAPLALASPEFARRYGGKIAVGGSTTALLSDGPETAERVRSAVASFPQTGVATAEDQWVGTTRAAINVMTIGLLIFAAIALLAGAIAVGQTISRQLASDSDALLVTRAVGLTRAERVMAGAAPVLAAALLGSLLGVALAIASSGLFPLAIARAAEPSPGLSVDLLVLGGGWLMLVVCLAGWTLLGARRADRRATNPSATTRSKLALPAILSRGSRVAPVLGVRLALDRDTGRANLPTRSTLFGAATAVLGVVAVGVFGSSLTSALATPADFGWTWSSRPDLVWGSGPMSTLDDLVTEEDLQAVGAVFKADAKIGAVAVPLQAFASVKGSIEPPVRSGRLPASPGEVALGSSTLKATAHSVGDSISLNLLGGQPQDFTVVGEVVGNQMTSTPDLGVVAMVTPEAAASLAGVSGLSGLLDSDFEENALLTYRDGVAKSGLETRLEADHQLSFVAYSRPAAPGRLLNMEDMQSLLVGIAGFFAAIGTLALVHLLVVSTRRRSREFGTLRALGLVRRQLRSAIWIQGLTIIGVGLVIGLPTGIALGRWSWRAALSGVGMIASPTTPWAALAGFVSVAVGVTSLISLMLGSWAARARPAASLLAE